jgi:hypothetical protein
MDQMQAERTVVLYNRHKYNMPIIYKFTHAPTNKYYIGAKKDDDSYHSGNYYSSSKVVSSMMKANPEQWTKEVLYTYSSDTDFSVVINHEQKLIQEAVNNDGWDSIWNKHCRLGDGKLWNTESVSKNRDACKSPEYREKKASITKQHWQNPENYEKNEKRREHIRNLGKSSKAAGSTNYKGPTMAVSTDTGDVIIMRGETDIKLHGFNPGHVSSCVNGRLKHHKKHTFQIITEEQATIIENERKK